MKKAILLFLLFVTQFFAFSQVTTVFNWDTIKFETPYQYIEIDPSSENIWEIGEPDKVFFNSAYTGLNAILTNVNDYYPINNYSFFDLYIGEYNSHWYPYAMFFEIQHKFDTDSLRDGGYITVSYNKLLYQPCNTAYLSHHLNPRSLSCYGNESNIKIY